ncbi:hypothetical protein [Methanobacterium sp.]|jgi:hypothetical protein|uniref:hypothetical protein n=1 Tax=unclassified Methanobacterium TaxID=2627676 RepID=UPI0031594BC2
MEDRQIDFIMYIVGVLGLIILLGGVFNLYEFKYGLFGAIILWIIAGGVRKYMGIPK